MRSDAFGGFRVGFGHFFYTGGLLFVIVLGWVFSSDGGHFVFKNTRLKTKHWRWDTRWDTVGASLGGAIWGASRWGAGVITICYVHVPGGFDHKIFTYGAKTLHSRTTRTIFDGPRYKHCFLAPIFGRSHVATAELHPGGTRPMPASFPEKCETNLIIK